MNTKQMKGGRQGGEKEMEMGRRRQKVWYAGKALLMEPMSELKARRSAHQITSFSPHVEKGLEKDEIKYGF